MSPPNIDKRACALGLLLGVIVESEVGLSTQLVFFDHGFDGGGNGTYIQDFHFFVLFQDVQGNVGSHDVSESEGSVGVIYSSIIASLCHQMFRSCFSQSKPIYDER